MSESDNRKYNAKVIAFLGLIPMLLLGMGYMVYRYVGTKLFEYQTLITSLAITCICCVILLILYLFSPRVCLCIFVRIFNRKVEGLTGSTGVLKPSDLQASADDAIMKKVEASPAGAKPDNICRADEYIRRIDSEVDTIEGLLRNAVGKGCARRYLNDIVAILQGPKIKRKEKIIYRFIYAFIYDVCDGLLFSYDDYKSRIVNMRDLVANFKELEDDKQPGKTVFELLFSMFKGAFKQNHDDLVIEIYDILKTFLARSPFVFSDSKSVIYELVGTVVGRNDNDWNKAIMYFNMSLRYNPKNVTAWWSLAVLYYEKKQDFVNAYNCADKCYALLPEGGDGGKTDYGWDDFIQEILYMCAFALGDVECASQHITGMDTEFKDARITGNKAYLFYQLGKGNDAMRMAQRALSNDPETYSALNVMGALSLKRGDYKKAYSFCKAAIKGFKPDLGRPLGQFFYGELCNNLAIACSKLSKFDEARTWFKKAISAKYPYVDVGLYDSLPPLAALR